MNTLAFHPPAVKGGLKCAVPDRICLIIPPSVFLLDERVFMTLGPLKVANVLEHAGTKVDVIDLSGVKNYLDVIIDYASAPRAPSIYGLTATTPQLPQAAEIVRTLRSVRPEAKLILGGPHITLVNAARKGEMKRNVANGRGAKAIRQLEALFDVLVAGDGEESIFAACHAESPKLIDADDRKSPFFLDNARLNATPWPARHLVEIDSYRYAIDGVPALSLIAQLGCPFECGFCGGRESAMLRHIRMRTSENIVAEMEHMWRTTGRTGFMFYDDELNVNKKMVELMGLITAKQHQLGVEWRLRGFVKSELFTDEQATVMYEAGFRQLLIGFESGSERILRNINKRATKEDNTRSIKIAHEHGLKVKALMSLGHPGETRATIEETRQWLLDVKPDDFDATIITAYPGTPYYDRAVPVTGRSGHWVYTYEKGSDRDHLYQIELDYTTTADYYKGDPDGGYKAYVYTDELSTRELVEERDRVERSVRGELNIPFNPGAPALLYEHSMGQSGIPSRIFRQSANASNNPSV